jgi:hypothetical protein
MIIFYSILHSGIRMYNPNPFSSKLHTTLYIGYSLSEAKKKWRQYLGLERKHIQWEEL